MILNKLGCGEFSGKTIFSHGQRTVPMWISFWQIKLQISMKNWWYKLVGEPIVTVDSDGDVRKRRLIRLGPLLRTRSQYDWITVYPDGTADNKSYVKKWYYRNSTLPYNPMGILISILKTKEILPTLMGINPELDKLIEQELKK